MLSHTNGTTSTFVPSVFEYGVPTRKLELLALKIHKPPTQKNDKSTYAIIITTSILVGSVCAAIASKKNRDPFLWFFIGVTLNVIGLGVIYFLESRDKKNG